MVSQTDLNSSSKGMEAGDSKFKVILSYDKLKSQLGYRRLYLKGKKAGFRYID